MKKAILIIAVLIVAGLTAEIAVDIHGISGTQSVEVTIEEGEGLGSVAKKLDKSGVISHGFLFKRYVITKGLDTQIQAGTHTLVKKMGYSAVARELVNLGKSENSYTLMIPEGYEIYRIADKVEEIMGIPAGDFLSAAEDGSYDYDFLKGVPKRASRLEGYLFPDTYEIMKNANAADIVNKMLSGFKNVWSAEYENRAKEIGMSMDDVIKLASIIEREAGSEAEMGKVSSVFHNRIKAGMPLQSCATVQYILKERKDVLSIEDTKIDSEYNTYMYPGLPVGPIASPGRAAIKAALYPEATDYYYFKLNSDGVTVFSKTLEEHNSK